MDVNHRIAAILTADDDDRRFELLADLVRSDPEEVVAVARLLLTDPDAGTEARMLGADLLGQLARSSAVAPIPGREIPSVSPILLDRLAIEPDAEVRAAIISALGFTGDPGLQETIRAYANDSEPGVRFAVAWALALIELDAESLATVRRLSGDLVDAVRDWATFALAESNATDAETVAALVARTDDPHAETRAEGIYGLARRRDRRTRGLIERELAGPVHSTVLVRAIEELERADAEACGGESGGGEPAGAESPA